MTRREKIGFILFVIILAAVTFVFDCFSQTQSDTLLVGRNSHLIDLGGNDRQRVFGGSIINYQNAAGVWKREDNSIKIYADSTSFGNTMVVKEARLWVEFPDSSSGFVIVGRRESNNLNSIVKQKFKGAAFYNRRTREYQFIAPSTVAATDILFGGNTIIYEDVYPGADLKYVKTDRYLKEELILSAALRGNLTDPYPGDETWIVLVSEIDHGILSFENNEHSSDVFGASFREDSTSYSLKRSGLSRINIPLQNSYLSNSPEISYKMKTFSRKVNGKNLMMSGIPLSLVSDTLNYPGELVFDPTFEIQPDATAGKDGQINSTFTTRNYGVSTNGEVSSSISTTVRQLYEFTGVQDSIPSDVVILSAYLTVEIQGASSTAGDLIETHRITRSWTEGTGDGTATSDGITWATYNGSSSWTTPGGDFDATIMSTYDANGKLNGDTLIIDMTSLYQGWYDGTWTNYGFILKMATEGTNPISGANPYNSDQIVPSRRPILTVNYTDFSVQNFAVIDSFATFVSAKWDTTLGDATIDSSFIIDDADSTVISIDFGSDTTGSTNHILTEDTQYILRLIVYHDGGVTTYSNSDTVTTTKLASIFDLSIDSTGYNLFVVSFDTLLNGHADWDSFAVLTDDSVRISDFYTDLTFSTYDTLADSTSYTIMIGGFNDDTLRTVSSSVTESTNHLVLGNDPYGLRVVSRFYNGAILSAVDSSGAGTNRAIFNDVNGLFTADTIELTFLNPDTFLDTVYFDGLYDTLINAYAVVIDTVDSTYFSLDTLSFHSMAQQVITLAAIDTSDTLVTFFFGPDSNSDNIFYRVMDSSTSFSVFVDPSSDTSATDTSWYVKTSFDTLTLYSGVNEVHNMFVEARNSDSLSTGSVLSDSVWTWSIAPEIDTVFAVGIGFVKLFVDSTSNPSYTYFAFEDSISGLFVDVETMSFRSSGITVDSSWAWGTYEDWGGSSGALISVIPGTVYVLRGYSKDGNNKDQN